MLNRLSSFSGPLSKLFTSIRGFTLPGLILRYEMYNSNTYYGLTTIDDLVENSNATLINGPVYSSNGYLNIDGTNDYIITSTSLNSKLSPPNTSTIISYFLWVYPMDNGVLITEQGTSTLSSVWHDSQIEIVNGDLEFFLWPGLTFISSIPISSHNWYYVGLTYDGLTMKGYINGQVAGTTTGIRQTPYNNGSGAGLFYAIGAADTTNLGDGTYAKAKFGAFHVYNTALSQQQVLNNYNSTKSNYIHTNDLLIWLDANDPQSFSGGSVFDISGNNYTHSLTTGATSAVIYGIKCFDCTTGDKKIAVDGTGPTLSTTGYTYVIWARAINDNTSFRTLLYTKSPRYTPITIPNGTNDLGYWDIAFRSSGYDLSSFVDVWAQYSVVGDNSSQAFYINGSQVGSSISYGSGGNLHDGLGNNLGVSQPFGYVANMMLYNSKLTVEQIKQNYDALSPVYNGTNFITSNLKLYFNPSLLTSYSGTGSTVSDLSGNSLSGTLSNVTFNKKYFDFNGTSSQISISDNALLEPGTGNWTMEVWFKVDNVSGSQVILGKFDTGGGAIDVSYSVRINSSSSVYSQIGNGLGGTLNTHYSNSTGYTITTSTWYQAVYVYSNTGDTFTTYINGSSIGTVSSTIGNLLNTTSNLYIGSYNNGEFSQYFNGQIGIVRIYSSALSAADVSQNFEANRSTYSL